MNMIKGFQMEQWAMVGTILAGFIAVVIPLIGDTRDDKHLNARGWTLVIVLSVIVIAQFVQLAGSSSDSRNRTKLKHIAYIELHRMLEDLLEPFRVIASTYPGEFGAPEFYADTFNYTGAFAAFREERFAGRLSKMRLDTVFWGTISEPGPTLTKIVAEHSKPAIIRIDTIIATYSPYLDADTVVRLKRLQKLQLTARLMRVKQPSEERFVEIENEWERKSFNEFLNDCEALYNIIRAQIPNELLVEIYPQFKSRLGRK